MPCYPTPAQSTNRTQEHPATTVLHDPTTLAILHHVGRNGPFRLQLLGSILTAQSEPGQGSTHANGMFIDSRTFESLMSTEAAVYGWGLYWNISRYTL